MMKINKIRLSIETIDKSNIHGVHECTVYTHTNFFTGIKTYSIRIKDVFNYSKDFPSLAEAIADTALKYGCVVSIVD